MLFVLPTLMSKLSEIINLSALAALREAHCQAVLLTKDGCYTGQGLALDGLEHGTAASRDVGYLIGKAELVDGCYRVATAHERVSAILGCLGNILGDFAGAMGKVLELKYADRTVPQDGLGVEEGSWEAFSSWRWWLRRDA